MIFPPYTLQTKLIATATLCMAFFIAGWVTHGWKTDAGVTRTIAKQEKTRQAVEKDQAKIVADGDKQDKADRAKFSVIREKINDQNDQSICFNAESLKLWNDAVSANADSYRRKSIVGPGTAEATEGQSDQENESNAEIVASVEQVLTNGTENIETCTRNINKHLRLIDAVRAINDKMCVCSD